MRLESCDDVPVLNDPVAVRLWHAAIAVVLAGALIVQVLLTVDRGYSVVNLFSYFTIQSNILVMISAALVAVDPLRDGAVFQAVRMGGLVGITVTGVVYQVLLVGDIHVDGIDLVLDNVFHRFIPIAAVLGYLLLRPRSPLGPKSWWFLAWSFGWLAYTLIRAEVFDPTFKVTDTDTAPVPYGFLDVETEGVAMVIVTSAAITAVAVMLAVFYRWVASRPRRSAMTSNT